MALSDEARRVSRDHTNQFLKRERREIEELRGEWGTSTVEKLEPRLVREVLSERRRRQQAKMLGAPEPRPQQLEVIVSTKGGRKVLAMRPAPSELSEKRRAIAELQRSGRLHAERLASGLLDDGLDVIDTLWSTGSAVVRLGALDLELVAARADVSHVVSNKPVLPLCLNVSRPLIKADQVANNLGFDGTGVQVAVIDTGVDAAHPALVGVVTSQIDLTGAGTGDGFGHGTHCAGIVASQDGTFHGIAPGARITDIRIMDANGSATPQIMVQGVQTAMTAGVDVASCSWGLTHANGGWADPPTSGAPDDSCIVCTAVAAAVDAGVCFIIAAGNEDNDSCNSYDTHIRCPGLADSAVTVGASDDSDHMADFSSVGPTPAGRQKPDLTAPGVHITSCRASGTSLGTPVDANFTTMDGTSMATPHVAGVAALMLQKNPKLTPAAIKTLLTSTTVNIGASAPQMGAGRVDALAAVTATP